MPRPTLATLRTRVQTVIQDDAGYLTTSVDGEIDQLIRAAVKIYSRLKPRMLVQRYVGNGGYSYSLPSGWDESFSIIKEIEYPDGDQPPTYIDRRSYVVYMDHTGPQVFFKDDSPASTEHFLVWYSALHRLDGAMTTVPEIDEDALVDIAGSLACRSLAARYAQTTDSTIGADAVAYGDRAARYAELARALKSRAYEHLGIPEKGAIAASVTMDWDWGTTWKTDKVFHQKHLR